MATTIGLARTSHGALGALSKTSRGVAGAVTTLARTTGHGVGWLAFELPSLALPSRGSFSLSLGLPSLLGSSRRRLRRRSSASSGTEPDEQARFVEETDPDPGPMTVEEAFEAMIEDLPVRRRHARTPGEFARTAIDVGLPRDPVRTLTDTFCEIRYGGRRPTPDRTRRAREAFAAIRAAREGGEEE